MCGERNIYRSVLYIYISHKTAAAVEAIILLDTKTVNYKLVVLCVHIHIYI